MFKLGSYNKISAGTEYTNDYMKNPGNLEEPEEIYTLALYAQDEIRLWKNLQILPGFRYVYNEMFKNRFTPIALMYTLGSFNFRTSYAAGFKTPTRFLCRGLKAMTAENGSQRHRLQPEASHGDRRHPGAAPPPGPRVSGSPLGQTSRSSATSASLWLSSHTASLCRPMCATWPRDDRQRAGTRRLCGNSIPPGRLR